MKTTQAWGWLAAGVLALGLNGIYHEGGGAAWARRVICHVVGRIEQKTGPVLALASGRAGLFLAKAGMAAPRTETAACRFATSMARVHTKIARSQAGFADFEAMSAREEAALARVEANRARIEAQVARVHLSPVAFDAVKIPVICPRVQVSVPQVNIPRINIPRVNIPNIPVRISALVVDVDGAGPI